MLFRSHIATLGEDGSTFWIAAYQLPFQGLVCEKIGVLEVPMTSDVTRPLVNWEFRPPGIIWAAKLGSSSDQSAEYRAYRLGHSYGTGYWGAMQAAGAGRRDSFGVLRSDIVDVDGPFPQQLSFDNQGSAFDGPPVFAVRLS